MKVSNPTSGYVPKGNYHDAEMSASDKSKIDALQNQYDYYKSIGDKNGMNQAHAAAQSIREQYGYSGGGDGSMYLPIQMEEDTIPKVGLPSYQAQIGMTNNVYDAAQKAALAALEKAYNQSRLEAENAMAKIPGIYQQQANAVAAEAERQRAAQQEMAAYSGMNAGNGSQVSLAMSNQLQNNLGNLRTAEANATTEAQQQMTALYVKYQDSIAEAIANNEYSRAAALLSEYQKAAQSMVDVAQNQAALDMDVADFNRTTHNTNYEKQLKLAQTLAQFGDFTGYQALGMSEDQVNRLRKAWMIENPNTAYYLGYGTYPTMIK